jgi:hypothetical protein
MHTLFLEQFFSTCIFLLQLYTQAYRLLAIAKLDGAATKMMAEPGRAATPPRRAGTMAEQLLEETGWQAESGTFVRLPMCPVLLRVSMYGMNWLTLFWDCRRVHVCICSGEKSE